MARSWKLPSCPCCSWAADLLLQTLLSILYLVFLHFVIPSLCHSRSSALPYVWMKSLTSAISHWHQLVQSSLESSWENTVFLLSRSDLIINACILCFLCPSRKVLCCRRREAASSVEWDFLAVSTGWALTWATSATWMQFCSASAACHCSWSICCQESVKQPCTSELIHTTVTFLSFQMLCVAVRTLEAATFQLPTRHPRTLSGHSQVLSFLPCHCSLTPHPLPLSVSSDLRCLQTELPLFGTSCSKWLEVPDQSQTLLALLCYWGDLVLSGDTARAPSPVTAVSFTHSPSHCQYSASAGTTQLFPCWVR